MQQGAVSADGAEAFRDHTPVVLRVWMPDRPGALGAVASRIGAVGGDLVGIEIVERGAGRAVDDLTVQLPSPDLVDLLVTEIHDVEGVDVEDVGFPGDTSRDPAMHALEVMEAMVAAEADAGSEALVLGAASLLNADWAAMVEIDRCEVLHSVGDEVPTGNWLAGFAEGIADGADSVQDVACAMVPGVRRAVILGRDRPALRERERRILEKLSALARMADTV
ncbi:MAG: hypothetical protein M9942_06315 [Microthrixaceae bacterium]|nr:hypothetical protein [Microthrixaceae bacterium]MCO5318037.1 hypothetical protein [Microthrixaceae bacterium]